MTEGLHVERGTMCRKHTFKDSSPHRRSSMSKPYARYLWIMLVIFLIACNQQTAPAPTEVPSPTLIIASVMPVPTSTFIFIPITPSPLPTKPILPGITPDSIQIERWNEYEEALAIVFFNGYFKREEVVCEWVMLGRAGLEVYVWAYCSAIYAAGPSAGSIPAVIHLQADGTVESAEIPGSG